MRTVLIHGQSHRGSTYHLAHMLGEHLGGTLTEFFLPRDFGEFCTGCSQCFMDSETKCPHFEKLVPITREIDRADVIILASPVYVYHATGAMKAFLDHYGWRWMVHRPEGAMFAKQAVCISTAAGAGMKSTNKDMADSAFFWGAGRVYRFGKAVAEVDWARVSEKKKQSAQRKLSALAEKIKRRQGRVKPGLRTKAFFYVMRLAFRHGGNPADAAYWKKMGWTGSRRPWQGGPLPREKEHTDG